MLPLKWTIGSKVSETGKIRVFLEALWQRIRSFEKERLILVRTGQDDLLVQTALHVTKNIRQIKKALDQKTDTQKADTLKTATLLFSLLNKTSALFLEIYFRSKFLHADPVKVALATTAGSIREIEDEGSYGQIKKMVA